MRWLVTRRPWLVPIPGTTKSHRLKANVGAASVDLSPEELGRIAEILATVQVQGERYPGDLAARVGT